MFPKKAANEREYIKDRVNLYVFNSDPKLFFLQKKSERLVAALYMITDLLSDREPLRVSLRQQGVALVAVTLSFIGVQRRERKSEEREALSLLEGILALLQVSRSAGVFSDMNVSVLKQECEALGALFVDSTHKNNEETEREERTALFPKDFFQVAQTDGVPEEAEGGHHGGKKALSFPRYPYDGAVNRDGPFGGAVKDAVPKDVKDIPLIRPAVALGRVNDRRSAILNLLRQKSPITIKDVVRVVTDCGEKTIQRELFAMVDDGTLKKSGERRWTTYSTG